MPRAPEELREAVESYLGSLELMPELGTLEEPVRYSLGGKRVRPVLCLAAGEAAGGDLDDLLPAAASVELVHSFSLVHDDLPALDDDEERRGQPSVWAAYGEATAILAGDALVAEAFRLALCQPNVVGIMIFHVVDESSLGAWQSGPFYADGTPKSSLRTIHDAAGNVRRTTVKVIATHARRVDAAHPAAWTFKRLR